MKRRLQPTSDQVRPSRNARRALLTAVGVTLAIAVVPASAGAAVRTGSVDDPQGDASALSGPANDIRSVAVRYDDVAGAVRVTWTFYNDVRTQASAGGAGGNFWATGTSSAGLNVGWMFPTDASSPYDAYVSLGGPNGGTLRNVATVSNDGRVVTVEATSPALAGQDLQRGSSGVAGGDGFADFWFDGYSDPNPPVSSPPLGPTGPGTTPPGTGGGNQGMTINDGAIYTNDPDVTLSIDAPRGVSSLRVSNDGGFRAAKNFPVRTTIRWHLAESGPERLPKTVYLRFGNDAQTFTDDIILDQTKPTVSSATVDAADAATRTAAVAEVASSNGRNYRVRIRAKDATSGVAKVQFAVSKRHPSSARRFARVSRYAGKRAPKYVRVQDRAGNYSAWRSVR
jgi:hypothetical protein